jgi:hypothetical protein
MNLRILVVPSMLYAVNTSAVAGASRLSQVEQ